MKDPDSDDDCNKLLRVPNYFEDLALMVETGRLELPLVERGFAEQTVRAWDHWAIAIARMRTDSPVSYKEFEALVGQLQASAAAAADLHRVRRPRHTLTITIQFSQRFRPSVSINHRSLWSLLWRR